MRGRGRKLGGPCPKVRLSQDRMPIEPFDRRVSEVRGKEACQVRGRGSKLGGPCPKVRLSQERMPIEPIPSRIS